MKIALCMTGKTFTKGFVESLVNTIPAVMRTKGNELVIITDYSADIYNLKNSMVNQALSNNADFIVWIDSDMVWKPSDIFDLIAHDVDIISGVACIESGRYAIASKEIKDDGITRIKYDSPETLPASGVVLRDYVGGAFLCVKADVYRNTTPLWYQTIVKQGENGLFAMISEDFGWCERVKEQGYTIHVDTNVRVGHEKGFVLWA